MLPLEVRARVRELLQGSLTTSTIARQLRVSLSSIKRIAKEPETPCTDDASERRRRRIGRPSVTAECRSWLVETLKLQPRLRTMGLLSIAREKGYAGSKSAFYDLVVSLRRGPEDDNADPRAAAPPPAQLPALMDTQFCRSSFDEDADLASTDVCLAD